jgi:hypothetical protein
MSAIELDETIPERRDDIMPAHLDRIVRTPPAAAPRDELSERTTRAVAARDPVADRGARSKLDELSDRATPPLGERKIEHDALDDGWGPPGTTIPPPLLGAIPDSGGTPQSGVIPIPNLDSAPLIVAAPSPPEPARNQIETSQPAVRAVEDAMHRVLDLIRTLEHALDRDEVIAVMIAHVGESHRRAGFFAVKSGELTLFAMSPRPPGMPVAAMRLDRPSTLLDVVNTRLPYRGPMHDDASRTFLTSVLGGCPPEILLVPLIVRDRVVGVLFGEHRLKHTFDDQLGLGARAAGIALERILKTKRP